MSDSDLMAIATYLKDLPPAARKPHNRPVLEWQMRAGEAIFTDTCSACHGPDGTGVPGLFPSLQANAAVQSRDPTTLVRIILGGTRAVPTPARPTPVGMPSFAWKLNDDEVAAVATFVRNSWGNSAPAVSLAKVAKLRRSLAHAATSAANPVPPGTRNP